MMIVMQMSSGRAMNDPAPYDEEVLNASWLPPQPEVALQLQEAVEPQRPRREMLPPVDVEAFLNAMYRSQE
ncbi:hypothetical protein GPA19_16090 [Azoarcus indigens]|uniref:Uncharacterized protein n=1 Tax=Azoarcus indigens TaxID=29545 RepID=A0A4R6DQM0_9RHOO|nr:hypothetical protein [Azoarcus indigens]NMG66466.1 hypothetical protein [Azoarcus indigens]TDN47365.1 hypothetical protein C7389_12032 [Azoarcus indigens]